MIPGQLRFRVDIQKPVETKNAYGEPEVTWTNVAKDIWANIEPLDGQETWESKQVNASLNSRITMRYRSDLQANYRILHGTNEYYIYSLINVGERNREMKILCTRPID